MISLLKGGFIIKKLILFFAISILAFGNSQEALKNALDRLYGNNTKIAFDIRTAKALEQPGETVTTILYNKEEKSGYSSEIAIGEEYSCKITLFPGFEYVIVGAGDNAAIDVDIFVYDTLENTVALDRSTDATAYAKLPKDFSLNPSVKIDKSIAGSEITIRPYEKEKYTVKLKLRDSKNPKSSVAFIVGTKRLK